MTVAQALVRALADLGVRTVFGIPGIHNLDLYDALLGFPAIRHVLTRHEQGAGFMADGYARASGGLGVCFTTTGPGASNTATPLAEAYTSSVPVLLIASQIESALVGRGHGALHEYPDQLGLLGSLAGFAARIDRPEAAVPTLLDAVRRMGLGRPRPSYLEIPYDILAAEVPASPALPPRLLARPGPDPRALDEAARRLARAQKPIIYAGGGVVAAEGSAALRLLAERLRCPVVLSVMGRGALPADHPLYAGGFSAGGHVGDLIAEADLLLAVGTRFSRRSLRRIDFRAPDELIHVDLDPEEPGKLVPTTLAIVSDARAALEGLAERVTRPAPGWGDDLPADLASRMAATRAHLAATRGGGALALLDAIRAELPREALTVHDQSIICYWAEYVFPVYAPRTFLYPVGSGTLGYALPAAIGAKLARPDAPVVALAGDGGFMFTCQELSVAVQERLALPILLFNDARLGVIKRLQERRFKRSTEVDLVHPDFVRLAEAFGARGVRLEAGEDPGPALGAALAARGPTLIEIPVDLEPPW